MILGVVLAVLAAGANAVGSVLQRAGARTQPEGSRLTPTMLVRLFRRPAWPVGVLATFAGLVLQVLALANAPIVVVQCLLVSELGFVLLLSSFVFRTRLPVVEWVALGGLGAGVALLLLTLSPRDGDADVPALGWIVGGALTMVAVGVLMVAGSRHEHASRAACFGVAAGMWFGFTAVLVNGITSAFTHGIAAVFTAWQTYAMLVAGPAGFLLLQKALRAGPLVASQPGLTLANPLVALGWGIVVFGERVHGGAWILGELAGAALIVLCTVQLARSAVLDEAA